MPAATILKSSFGEVTKTSPQHAKVLRLMLAETTAVVEFESHQKYIPAVPWWRGAAPNPPNPPKISMKPRQSTPLQSTSLFVHKNHQHRTATTYESRRSNSG